MLISCHFSSIFFFLIKFLVPLCLVQFGLYVQLDQKHNQGTKPKWCTKGMAISLLFGLYYWSSIDCIKNWTRKILTFASAIFTGPIFMRYCHILVWPIHFNRPLHPIIFPGIKYPSPLSGGKIVMYSKYIFFGK